MYQGELKNDWARVQEIFSNFCRPHRLAHEAKLGFTKDGRGAIFLYRASGSVVCTFADIDWITESIESKPLKQTLLSSLEVYDPQTQAIVLVSFDDIFLSQTLHYQWFEVNLT